MNICKEEDRGANATRAEKLSCVLPRKAPTTIARHSWAGTWCWEPEQDPTAVGIGMAVNLLGSLHGRPNLCQCRNTRREKTHCNLKHFLLCPGFLFQSRSFGNKHTSKAKAGVLSLALLLAHAGFASLYTGSWCSKIGDVELLCQTGHPIPLHCEPGPGREPRQQLPMHKEPARNAALVSR